MIFRLAQDNEISNLKVDFYFLIRRLEIQPTFFQIVCPCCFLFFVPGTNCIQKFHTIKQIRRFKEKKTKNGIKSIIFSSQLIGVKDKNTMKKSIDACFTTFKCNGCKTFIVYDTAPLEFIEHQKEVQTKAAKPVNPPRKENLQKVLQKSQIPKESDSAKKEMDLESFLQGFL